MNEFAPGLVTVFGGSGFVGGQVVRALAKKGWRVRVACRRPDRAWKLQTAGSVGQIQAVRCDASQHADVARAVEGADAVVNLIGILFESGHRSFQALHLDTSERIARAANEAGVARLVQMSAIGADPAAKSDYARTKGLAEQTVRRLRPDAVIVRPSVVFGSGDDFTNKFAQMAQFAPALPLIGGGRTRFQPVFVGDVAEAVALAATRADLSGKTLELGGPAVMTFEDILKLILRETHRQRALAPVPWFAARVLGSVAQLTALVGLKPILTRDQVISLESDNVVGDDAVRLTDLGIQPTGMQAVAEGYLWRYRRGGQFAERNA